MCIMKKISAGKIAKIGIIATLYIGATMAVAPLSFGAVQLRLSEVLVLLCFYNPEFSLSLIIGCFITNLYSPLTYYDLIFGVISTVFTVAGIVTDVFEKPVQWLNAKSPIYCKPSGNTSSFLIPSLWCL